MNIVSNDEISSFLANIFVRSDFAASLFWSLESEPDFAFLFAASLTSNAPSLLFSAHVGVL